MYCICGTDKEMKVRQEKDDRQAKGETINYLHCDRCGRNHLPASEKAKIAELDKQG